MKQHDDYNNITKQAKLLITSVKKAQIFKSSNWGNSSRKMSLLFIY